MTFPGHLFSFRFRVESLNKINGWHWSKKAKYRATWATLFRSQLARGWDCGDNHAVVRIVSFRNREIDPDNFVAGCKQLCDAMKHVRLIKDDRKQWATFSYEQIQVPRGEEHTDVLVSYVAKRGNSPDLKVPDEPVTQEIIGLNQDGSGE